MDWAVGRVSSSGNCTAGADFAGIKTLLAQGQTAGWWHYEVGCGTDAWWNA
ncbi:hypothetical protein ACFYXV_32310 [Streptomyces sp. NPDC002181]|uniref:hypothetical protein n=1 Tax=Streptomyces sp. NPDC002181 TaxID=3364635 RepID=UPI0036A073EF